METTHVTWDGPLSLESVTAELKKSLFGPLSGQVTSEALRAEILRVALWELGVLSQPASIADAAVSTRKLLHRARMLLGPFQALATSSSLEASSDGLDRESAEDHLNREALDTLATQGDIQPYPAGRWLPAPLRFVPLMHNHMLVVGGMPTALLSSGLRRHVQLHGSFRRCLVGSVSGGSHAEDMRPFQSVESWLGAPAISLPALLQRFQGVELLPVETSSSFSRFDVYAPTGPVSGRPQFARWQPMERVASEGRYLLRRSTSWGWEEYTVGLVEQKKLKAQGMIDGDLEVRRLLYALDAQAGNPTSAMWNREQGILTLHSELPMRERKYLATLGMLKKNKDGKYYPRVWRIPSSWAANVRELLIDLNIDLQEVACITNHFLGEEYV